MDLLKRAWYACFALKRSSEDLVEAISIRIQLFLVNLLVASLTKKASRSAGPNVHNTTARCYIQNIRQEKILITCTYLFPLVIVTIKNTEIKY